MKFKHIAKKKCVGFYRGHCLPGSLSNLSPSVFRAPKGLSDVQFISRARSKTQVSLLSLHIPQFIISENSQDREVSDLEAGFQPFQVLPQHRRKRQDNVIFV